MARQDRFYIVENEAGEPCVGADGVLLHTTKKLADGHAWRNSRLYQERYTVATFVRERALIRATGVASARATDKLIGRAPVSNK